MPCHITKGTGELPAGVAAAKQAVQQSSSRCMHVGPASNISEKNWWEIKHVCTEEVKPLIIAPRKEEKWLVVIRTRCLVFISQTKLPMVFEVQSRHFSDQTFTVSRYQTEARAWNKAELVKLLSRDLAFAEIEDQSTEVDTIKMVKLFQQPTRWLNENHIDTAAEVDIVIQNKHRVFGWQGVRKQSNAPMIQEMFHQIGPWMREEAGGIVMERNGKFVCIWAKAC